MKLYNIKVSLLAGLLSILGLSACNDYLDVVPDDGNATIDNAFNLRSVAIRYLSTCYSYMPLEGSPNNDPALLGSDEYCDLWGRVVSTTRVSKIMSYIARGYQNKESVYANDWSTLYIGIRDCGILMENIHNVPDMDEDEKAQWSAEARFLRAYYHFCLVRKWGPIPIIKENLPMDASVDDVRVFRDPIDSCFNFILSEIDQAIPYLAESFDETEWGRVDKTTAYAFKARVACYAASPLFNGNNDEASLVDSRGTKLFPSKTDEEKLERWKYAMEACKTAIDECQKINIKLYEGEDIIYNFSDTLKTDLTLRQALCKNANSEVIWGNTSGWDNSRMYWQVMGMVNLQYKESTSLTSSLTGYRFIGVPLKVAEEFYTNHGVPINVDIDRQSNWNELDLIQGDESHKYYLESGYTTCKLNYNREPRFYASLGFDGGKWLGQKTEAELNTMTAEKLYDVECRSGKYAGKTNSETGPTTGYFPKKTFPYLNRVSGNNTQVSYTRFAWPLIRLADLYLLYSEAINEYEGPNGAHSEDLFKYIDAVRERAKIPGVKEAWDNYSNSPGRYNTQAGMRDIIHRERMIELAFEGQRFWDLRRWKEAQTEYAKSIYGFNVSAASPEDYYKRTLCYEQPFLLKDYFWPISVYNMEHNPNLIQNVGW